MVDMSDVRLQDLFRADLGHLKDDAERVYRNARDVYSDAWGEGPTEA